MGTNIKMKSRGSNLRLNKNPYNDSPGKVLNTYNSDLETIPHLNSYK